MAAWGASEYFAPSHRVSGIGVARDDLSAEMLETRAGLMVESQTFSILRDPRAVQGAKRITTDRKLQTTFRKAADESGLPSTLIEAIAYLESWGEARAESPSGPKGIMQISAATARTMGLRVQVVTRYRTTRTKVLIPASKGKKARYKTVTHKTPYVVSGRDDRLDPERAIPAAAKYLAGMERKFGGRDWAVFAYHCGQGCVGEMMEVTRRARGVPKEEVSVARMFFSANPVWNRELYEAIQQQMQRDYSPTYYFRVRRAEELLGLYRRDSDAFEALAQEYRAQFGAGAANGARAPHRLAVWLKRDDLVFRSVDDIRSDAGRRLVKPLERPEYFGYRLRPGDGDYQPQASAAALGTLTYIAFETRRLFDEMKPRGQTFQPLEVGSMVEPEELARELSGRDAVSHSSGQVFDIDYSQLPPAEVECLRFVLNDLGWNGYLGFVEEGRDNLHIGCSPSSREFFAEIYQEALEAKQP
jgi:hypothetical protein